MVAAKGGSIEPGEKCSSAEALHARALTLALAALVTAALLLGTGIAWSAGGGGGLTFEHCLTGDAGSGPAGSAACEAIGSATSTGAASGLQTLTSIAVSPEGESLYAAAKNNSAIARDRP